MENQSEYEKRLSEIKWCAQKICKLIKSDTGFITRFADICSKIEGSILAEPHIKKVEAKPPVTD